MQVNLERNIMGDINVKLITRASDRAKVIELIHGDEDLLEHFDECDSLKLESDETEMVQFTFNELKHPALGIETFLTNSRVPYDMEWDEGMECEGGSEYFRVTGTNGTQIMRFSDSKRNMIYLDDLIKSVELNRVAAFIEEMKSELLPIPWQEQDLILS